jgi:hypothetical protein
MEHCFERNQHCGFKTEHDLGVSVAHQDHVKSGLIYKFGCGKIVGCNEGDPRARFFCVELALV